MSPLNRREFLYTSVAVSIATVLARHLSAMSSEGARQPSHPVSQEACTEPSVQPQFGRSLNFVNWREQGLNLGEKAFRSRQFLR
jgi:hypothetical protein